MAEVRGDRDSALDEALNGVTFEQAMERLETIVAKLESGDVPLETAIELFQEGMELSRLCGRKLEQVERRIEMLVEGENGPGRKPFAPTREDGKGE
ncbi:exodeoxyribonuclease VII small subunit [Cohnella caldifontis]|uniref:exodeoxyribonuclease VII small subunit n=1 Tax=Cohnella caldifontis TaxID=3027471 RepID=UPI0023EC7ECD|nr:exodeoxyribonuclease VII small subunit [Cohnella sp. YIM B05605]